MTVLEIFEKQCKDLKLYGDSSSSTIKLSQYDFLLGLQKGIKNGWFIYNQFDIKKIESMSRYDNGDMNWIIPDKIIA